MYIGPMERIVLDHDIRLMTVRADSFPDGIQNAFGELQRRLPAGDRRMPYGVSKPEKDGTIVYRAGVASEGSNEAGAGTFETVVLRKGTYAAETVADWPSKVHTLSEVFARLLKHPHLDPATPCIEMYRSRTELVCMVRVEELMH